MLPPAAAPKPVASAAERAEAALRAAIAGGGLSALEAAPELREGDVGVEARAKREAKQEAAAEAARLAAAERAGGAMALHAAREAAVSKAREAAVAAAAAAAEAARALAEMDRSASTGRHSSSLASLEHEWA